MAGKTTDRVENSIFTPISQHCISETRHFLHTNRKLLLLIVMTGGGRCQLDAASKGENIYLRPHLSFKCLAENIISTILFRTELMNN